MGEEKGVDRRASGMEGRECSKNHGRVGERVCVSCSTENRIDPSQPARGAKHLVMRRGETMDNFIPRGCAWERNLHEDPDDVQIPKSTTEKVKCLFLSEKPQESGDKEREGEMNDTVW